ncbi:MAG TPA: PAS domain-containing sensor histidine kinase [Cytophagaceae bacterium]
MNDKGRIEEINNLIIELASGNFDIEGITSDQKDEYDAIVTGINMLGEELRASTVSRDYLKSIFLGVVDMLIVLDKDNNIIEVNRTVTQLLGFEESELIGKSIESLLAAKTSSLKIVYKKLEKKGVCYNIEKYFRGKNNNIIPVSCSASLLYDNFENVKGTLYIAKDISKIKKTEEDLKLKNQELDTFIYRAAHDLKGPVASILGITNIAPLDVTDPIALQYFLMVQQCSEKLDKVLKHLREVAAIDKASKERKKLDLVHKVDTVLAELKNLPGFDKINIIKDLQQPEAFYGNAKMMRMIIYHLLDNSIKFKRDGENPFIRIKLKEINNVLHIQVEDNGIGIKKKLHHKIYDMFFRANTSSEGSGLGLYMVKTFVKSMRGEITMKSVEKKGTSFSIMIPNMKEA